jgi:hypothetical protein
MFKPENVRLGSYCNVAKLSVGIHTQVNRMELDTQGQQRDSDSVHSYEAADFIVDDQHWEVEERYLILMEVHLV